MIEVEKEDRKVLILALIVSGMAVVSWMLTRTGSPPSPDRIASSAPLRPEARSRKASAGDSSSRAGVLQGRAYPSAAGVTGRQGVAGEDAAPGAAGPARTYVKTRASRSVRGHSLEEPEERSYGAEASNRAYTSSAYDSGRGAYLRESRAVGVAASRRPEEDLPEIPEAASRGTSAPVSPSPEGMAPEVVRAEEPRIQDVFESYWDKHAEVRQYEADWFEHEDLALLTENYLKNHDPVAFGYGLAASQNFRALALKYVRSPVMLSLLKDSIRAASWTAVHEAAGLLLRHKKLASFLLGIDRQVLESDAGGYSLIKTALPSPKEEETILELPQRLDYLDGLKALKN